MRKPAAHVFHEQQQQKKDFEDYENEADYAVNAVAPPAPIIQQAARNMAPAAAPQAVVPLNKSRGGMRSVPPVAEIKTSEELQLEKEPLQVRITGFGRWKRVIVPPNAYVVHTRLGKKEPVTLGLGVSFRYNPNTDAYLVVPAAMQTIGVVANCISQEKQGINVLAYVQWQISDFSIAYRRLDFSDSRDPLSIVNAQLREQAEAAIKDKIATMSVEEVLTDKAPVIEELTRRLIAVSEGRGGTDTEGLGIKIVTVQIKEAFVSSQRLWDHLQAPYRHKQEQSARISELAMSEVIRSQSLENRRVAEISEAEIAVEIERTKQGKETEAAEFRLSEEAKRLQLEEQLALVQQESDKRIEFERLRVVQEKALETLRLDTASAQQEKALEVERRLYEAEEQQRLLDRLAEIEQQRLGRETAIQQAEHQFALILQELEQNLERQALESRRHLGSIQLEIDTAAHQAKTSQSERDMQVARLQQEVWNLVNDQDLMRRLIEQLPEIVQFMPDIQEMRVLQLGDAAPTIGSFLASLLGLLEQVKQHKTS